MLRYLFHNLWERPLHALGWLNTRILLTVIFFLLFSPIALVRRLLGKDPLFLFKNKMLSSYRCEVTDANNDLRKPY